MPFMSIFVSSGSISFSRTRLRSGLRKVFNEPSPILLQDITTR